MVDNFLVVECGDGGDEFMSYFIGEPGYHFSYYYIRNFRNYNLNINK